MRELIQPIGRRRLSDDVIGQLKTLLIEKNLKPGDKLPPERDLSGLFQVGRPSIREALRTLDILGFVDIRPGDGVYVRDPRGGSFLRNIQESLEILVQLEPKTLLEIFEVRMILEAKTASMAAQFAGPEDLAFLQNAFRELEDHLTDPKSYSEKDWEFHKAIARCSQNNVLFHLINLCSALIKLTSQRFLAVPNITAVFHPDHRTIFQAIQNRSEKKAVRAMTEHLFHAKEYIQRLLRNGAKPGGGGSEP
jgi:GntR family transcriptional regulator, transcriptional repressor for pyruvate dehydrogenase complex